MKKCIKCNVEKQMDMFHKWTASKDGRVNQCKDCVRENSRRWYQKNRERVLATKPGSDASVDLRELITGVIDAEQPTNVWVTAYDICEMIGIEKTKSHATAVGYAAKAFGWPKSRTKTQRLIQIPAPL